MSEEKVLTKEIAKEYVDKENEADIKNVAGEFPNIDDYYAFIDVNLSTFTSINMEAAEILVSKKNQDEDINLSGLTEISTKVASKLAKYTGSVCFVEDSIEQQIENAKDPVVTIEKIDSQASISSSGTSLINEGASYRDSADFKILDHCFTVVQSEGGSLKNSIAVNGQDLVPVNDADNNFLRMFAEAVLGGLSDDSIISLSGEKLSVILANSLSPLDFDQQEECLSYFRENYL
jgi:hypothetical protein